MSRYRTLSDEELLSEFDSKRQHSDVIDELCERLERSTKEISDQEIDCPICNATILLDVSRHCDQLLISPA